MEFLFINIGVLLEKKACKTALSNVIILCQGLSEWLLLVLVVALMAKLFLKTHNQLLQCLPRPLTQESLVPSEAITHYFAAVFQDESVHVAQ